MKELSDPNRVKIITMPGVRELGVCELTALLGVGQGLRQRLPEVQHLRKIMI
ncbi:MAG: hypothetical protein WC256_12835 [Desulfurivibrionaceae bacterium]|jgi:hypothetical protein